MHVPSARAIVATPRKSRHRSDFAILAPLPSGHPTRRAVAEIDRDKTSTCSFEAAQLHVGERLQIEFADRQSHNHFYTSLIGFLPGHSVLVRTPQVQNVPVPVPEGTTVVVRAFSGRHASAFESRVDRVCRVPYAYLHLAYPSEVRQTTIRGDLRVRVALPGTASDAGKAAGDRVHPVVISDLSISGAQIECEEELGPVGGTLALAFKFTVQPNNYEVKLASAALIQSVRKLQRGKGQEGFSHGVRFGKLHSTEALLLQSFVHEVLLSDRGRVA